MIPSGTLSSHTSNGVGSIAITSGCTTTFCVVVVGHGPFVVYSTVCTELGNAPVMVPVTGSIVAPVVVNAKVPPDNPVTVAVAPSQVGSNIKLELSAGNTFNTNVLVAGHWVAVVYSTV